MLACLLACATVIADISKTKIADTPLDEGSEASDYPVILTWTLSNLVRPERMR